MSSTLYKVNGVTKGGVSNVMGGIRVREDPDE
jgi:hypothetical protein